MNTIKSLWLNSILILLLTLLLIGCGNSNLTSKPEPTQATQSSVTVKVSFSNGEVNNKLSKQVQKTTAEINSITLDVNSSTHFYVQGKPFTYILSKLGNYWTVSLPALPTSEPLTFTAKAYNAEGTLLYKGSYNTTLLATVTNDINISLIPVVELQQQVPSLVSLVFQNIDKTELLFTVLNPNRDAVSYQITANQEDDGSFSPDYGELSFEQGTQAQLQVHYNRPTTAGTYSYSLTMTDSSGNRFIATFEIEVVEKSENVQVNLNLPPSIDSIEAQSTSNSITLTANVHDDSEDTLSYEWDVIEGDVDMEGAIENESYLTKTLSLSNYGANSAFKIKLTVADTHGASSSMVYAFNGNHITRVKDYQLLFFAPNSETGKKELWKIDSFDYPILLKEELYDGSNGLKISNPIIINGIEYFGANDGTHGYELWRSDGTVEGTYMVKDINPSEDANPSFLTIVNGILYFRANDGTHGEELWRSDGTAEGTFMVKDIHPGFISSHSSHLTNVNGILYFNADNGTDRTELWRSDGTAVGTTMVKNINPDGDAFPRDLTNVNGILYFKATDGTHGDHLWRSDGTAAGTTMFKNIDPYDITNINDILYFNAYGSGVFELWRSDGTTEGTTMVKNININPTGDYRRPNLTNVNGVLYFHVEDIFTTVQLWRSDGTTEGTTMVVEDIDPYYMTNANGILYFIAGYGDELWKSDGTASGTTMVKDINPTNGDASLYELANVNGILYFSAYLDNNEYALWKSDGTEAGTVKVFPLEP